jgi:RNA polymerase sigma factor (sigma-70 family)
VDECWRIQAWLNAPVPRARLLRDVFVRLARVWRGSTPADAEDLWGEFCLDRLTKVTRLYDPAKGPFVPFMRTALHQACLRQAAKLRSRAERVPMTTDEELSQSPGPASHAMTPEQVFERAEWAERLRECVATLPEHHRTVIEALYFKEQPVAEIAVALGIREGAAKVRLHRARQELKKCLRLRVAVTKSAPEDY